MQERGWGSRTDGRACWVLRLALAGAALAAAWVSWVRYGELNSLLYSHGWASLEAARQVDRVAALGLVGVALVALAGRGSRWLAFAVLWFALEAVAIAVQRGKPLPWLTLPSHAARYGAPLALLLLIRGRGHGAWWVLRLAAAATFAAHGVEALARVPLFQDLLLLSARRFGLALGERHAGTLLSVLGVLDVVAALWILVRPTRLVALYMAAWGAATLLARLTAGGLAHWPEAASRLSNAAIPLALYYLLAARGHRRDSNP